MTSLERRKYSREVIRLQLRLQGKYSKQINAALIEIKNKFIDRFREVGINATGDIEIVDTGLMLVYNSMYRESVITFAKFQYRRLRLIATKGIMGYNAQWTDEVNAWLAQNGLRLVSTVTGNFRAKILAIMNEEIQRGVTEGLGIDEISRNIINILDTTKTEYWAERIARTETMRAANIGHMKGAKAHNFEVVKIWVAAKDHRTRRMPNDEFDHWILDGQKREMDEVFHQVGKTGRVANAQQPGDGPAGFSINCRCTVAFEPKRVNGKLISKR